MEPAEIEVRAARLRADGARVVLGVVSDSGGVMRGKSVPAARIESFARSGMGASLTWPVFCVDNHVAMTEQIGVVGDLRLALDLSSTVVLDGGLAWGVCDVLDQDGDPSPYSWRGVLQREADALAGAGLEVAMGHELEFLLTDADGRPLGDRDGWPCYGAGVFGELSAFAVELSDELTRVGLPPEQLHAEYGLGQFEVSLPPAPPVEAADGVLLARAVIGVVGRRHGLRASFSPVPFAGVAGNGAHLHVSFVRDGQPLLHGGDGPSGLHAEALSAVAGLVDGLPAAMAVLAGSVVSDDRMQPGHWSGAWACWGEENREAAVRLIAARRGNPHGANLEVKCVDSSANPWLSAGLVLGLARRGIESGAASPAPVEGDPAAVPEAERPAQLPSTAPARIAVFESSKLVRDVLGDPLHEAILAVRRHESTAYDGADAHEPTRFAWSG